VGCRVSGGCVVIHALKFRDAQTMHDKMCERLMFGTRQGQDWDWHHGTDVGLHNVVLGCDSFDWGFDLKTLWMPRTRWTMMCRQYIDLNALDQWREIVGDRLAVRGGRGIAVLRTNTVQGRGTGRNVRRRWGSCMLSLSFRRTPTPTITLHSRTTYFGYLAAMDITVANALAWEAYHLTGIHPSEMQFVWNLELAQFHGFRSLAWPLMQPAIKKQMDIDIYSRGEFKLTDAPGYRKALDGYWRLVRCDNEGKLYGDEKFSSFNRARRRFHTEVMGVEYGRQFAGGEKDIGPFPALPSVHTDELDFSVLQYAAPTDHEEDDDEE
jgi:hypothetical protein